MARCIRLGTLAVVVLLGVSILPAAAQGPSPVGRWRTVDDKTGEVASIVEILESDGALQAKVIRVFSPPGDSENPMCDACSGDLKGQPIVGMQIMWAMTRDGDEYNGGRIMDPENGKTYKCKLKVVDEGRKLEVRGYVGFSLFGRTQTWTRVIEGGQGH